MSYTLRVIRYARPEFDRHHERNLLGRYVGRADGVQNPERNRRFAAVVPEMVTTMPTLRHRNVILFGAAAYSPVVARFLEKCPFMSATWTQSSALLRRRRQRRIMRLNGINRSGLRRFLA